MLYCHSLFPASCSFNPLCVGNICESVCYNMKDISRRLNQVLSFFGTPYKYDKLPRDDSFRYLTLQPGVGNEPLKCSLCTAPLHHVSFEAISYVWGQDIKNKKIICDGRRINITINLYNVLQSLRLPDAPRKLWADGICINQDDVKEKGHQVAIMGQIYRSAGQVLIYVGPDEGGHGPQLCSLLDEVTEMIESVCRRLVVPGSNSFPYPSPNDPLLSDSRWKTMFYLLKNRWFRRGWVVREAAFAKIGKVIWGSSEFLWQDLIRVRMWLESRAEQISKANGIYAVSIGLHITAYARQHRQFTDALRIYGAMSAPDVLRDLNFAKFLEVSDPRDRIYAFMELSNDDTKGITIIPDYDQPFLDVYRQFAIEYTECTASPRILDYVCHPIGAVDLVAASWVPRWDVPYRPLPSKVERKRGLSPRNDDISTPVFIGDTTFKTRGVLLDRVRYTSVTMNHQTTPQILSKIWEDVKFHTDESPYGSTCMLDAFLDTLCLGRYQGQWETWRSNRAAFAEHARLTRGSKGGDDSLQASVTSSKGEETDPHMDSIKLYIGGFRFIATERGYLGLAPDNTQQGDLCGIVFGCRTPCILRPTAQENCFSFLGGTYLTGKESIRVGDDEVFLYVLGEETSKDWVEWDVEEQDIYLV